MYLRLLHSYIKERFMAMLGKTPETEDSSNRLLDLNTQLEWLKNYRFYRCGLLLEMVRICFINRGKTITMPRINNNSIIHKII
jgi:hypothetical protein